jgi:hypothetical protein
LMDLRPPKTKARSRREEALAEVRSYVSRWIIGISVLAVIILWVALAIYCAGLPGGFRAYGAALMISAASFIAGGLIGFLFGIPRALAGGIGIGSGIERRRLTANTNLEDISDWLTKIIVGATLVQLGSLAHRFGELAVFSSSIFGNQSEQNKAMAGAVILYSAILGFLTNYTGARTLGTFLYYISPSDFIPELENEPETRDQDSPEDPARDGSQSTGDSRP